MKNLLLLILLLLACNFSFAQGGFEYYQAIYDQRLIAEHIFQNNDVNYICQFTNARDEPEFDDKNVTLIEIDNDGNNLQSKIFRIDTASLENLHINIIKDIDSIYFAKVQKRKSFGKTTAVGFMTLTKNFDIIDSVFINIPPTKFGVPQFEGYWDNEGFYNFIFSYFETLFVDVGNCGGRIRQDLSDFTYDFNLNSSEIISTISPRINQKGALIYGSSPSAGTINITDSTFHSIDTISYGYPLDTCIYSSFMGHIKILDDAHYITCAEPRTEIVETVGSIGAAILNENFEIKECKQYAHISQDNNTYRDIIQARNQNIGITQNNIYIGGTEDLGWFYIYGNYANSLVVLKYDYQLNTLWTKRIHNDSIYFCMQSLISTDEGGCIINGSYNRIDDTNTVGIFVIKIDENGSTSSTKQISTNKADVISVSPNPVSSFLYVNLPQNFSQNDFTMSIYDANGILKIHQILKSEIDIQALPKGMIFYQINGKNGYIQCGKVIRQ
ncbi:MAG: T9SS type A sorting domain-containing protein [Saprospiraceae bacterium]